MHDESAMLFNLISRTKFPVDTPSVAIMCHRDKGPCFGSQSLQIVQPFNQKRNFKSSKDSKGYSIIYGGINKLTGELAINPYYKISELEVWAVRFKV